MNTAAELIGFLVYVLQLFIWIIIIQAILSWLVAFNVVNLNNRFVHGVLTGLDRLLNPVLRPIRNLLPDMGGIDLSPLVLILGVMLVQRLLQGLAVDLLV
jgi:YggT family protein